MRLQEEVAILRDMKFVHALALVGLIGLDQADIDGIPSDGLFGGLVENLRGAGTKDGGAMAAIGKRFEEGN